MPKRKIISIKDWKQKAQAGESVEGLLIRKQYLTEIKADDQPERILQFTISTGDVDRDNDVINPEGWKLDKYKKNPVVLWAHIYDEPPVAKALKVWLEDNKLKAKAEFTPHDLNPFGYMTYRMYKEGYLNATSVGFASLEWEWTEESGRPFGIDFLEQELLEFSAVPVPANPEALIEARSKGIDTTPLLEWAEKTLDGHYGEKGIWVPKRQAEEIVKILDTKKSFVVDGLKGVSPESISNETAPEDTPWEAPNLEDFTDESWDDLSDTEKKKIAQHFAWTPKMPPERYTDLKLPHHRPSDGKVVWRGVANAAARLSQSNIPEEDIPKVQEHLGKHYEAFDRVPPWEEQEESASFDEIKMAIEDMATELKGLHERMTQLEKAVHDKQDPDDSKELLVLELKEDEPEDELEIEPETLKDMVKEVMQKELQEFITQTTGRIY